MVLAILLSSVNLAIAAVNLAIAANYKIDHQGQHALK